MTFREIGIALRQIDVRTYNEFAMQARAWGGEIPLKNPYEEEEVVIPVKPEVLKEKQNEFFERKRRKHG